MNCIKRSNNDSNYSSRLPLKFVTVSLLASFASNPQALPIGGTVASGVANISSSTGGMIINQSTPNTIINWQSFSIGQNEAVHFLQPNSSSVSLNRVLGSDPSSILGQLMANGKVFLVNPNGILFGNSAQVNVGGLVASTLNISDANLMSGIYHFTGTNTRKVVNQGNISTSTDGGYVAMLGANVMNNGTISAKLGMVTLAAGTAITLDVVGDGLLNVTINRGSLNAVIQNGGLIQADGGQVLLTTQAAGNLLHSTVNNSGIIEAQTIENHNGTIRLLADMQTGIVNLNGSLNAEGGALSGDGGLIETSGSQVSIANNTIINTLAPHGRIGLWQLDPVNYTIAITGGDETPASVATSLTTSNRLITATNDITVSDPVSLATAQTLTLNAGHDVLINAPITAVPAGAGLVLTAGNNVNVAAPITLTAAGSTLTINAGNDVLSSAPILAIAAVSSITLNAGVDALIGGPVTGTAANTTLNISAVRDVTVSGAVTAVAANSQINMTAGRDVNSNAALLATAAGTVIDLSAGRNVNVNAAIAASAAGSSISLISGLNGTGPGITGGTVSVGAAVASLNTTIRFNPISYAGTSAEIAAYIAEVTGMVDAKGWVFARVNNKTYNGTTAAIVSFQGVPSAGGNITIVPGIATFDTKNVGTGKTAYFSNVAISGLDAARFALFASSGTTTANIMPALLTVTASSTSKVYGQTPTLNSFTTTGLIMGETIGSVAETSIGTIVTTNVAGGPYAIIPVSAGGGTFSASNYSINYVNGVLTVRPAYLTVTASNAMKVYGQSETLTAFSTTGLLNSETVGSVTETSTGTAATASVLGGPYAIMPSNAVGGTFNTSNYNLLYINGALSVTPANLLITIANTTKYYGDTPILTAFTVNGLLNGETIGAFTEASPGTAQSASVAGSPYQIQMSPANSGTFNNSNYNISYVNGTLSVLPRVQLPAAITTSAALGTLKSQAISLVSDWTPNIVSGEIPSELISILPNSPEPDIIEPLPISDPL